MMNNAATSNVRSVIARILNHIIMALNNRPRLPRFIFIFPDKDIVDYMNYFQWGVSFAFGAQLDWLLSQIERAIEAKKEGLSQMKPGAIAPGEPKVVYVKMIQRPYPSKAMSVKWKFNKALEDSVALRQHGYIMSINVNQAWFDRGNCLTQEGRVQFWNEFDDQVKKFDRQQISLHPIKKIINSMSRMRRCNRNHHHLHGRGCSNNNRTGAVAREQDNQGRHGINLNRHNERHSGH